MSRRSTRSTSGIALPPNLAAKGPIDGSSNRLASTATKSGALKGKKRSAVEDIKDSEPPQRSSKRSKGADSGENGSGPFPKVARDSPVSTHIKKEESSVSVTKKVVTSRTKGNIEKKVKTEEVKEEVKQGQVEEVPAIAKQKQKPTKGRKTKGKESEEMPLAIRTKGLKMFVGAHVSAAQGAFCYFYFGFIPSVYFERDYMIICPFSVGAEFRKTCAEISTFL